MTVGIVIVTYECREFVLACLASIEQHLGETLPYTVIVDNASTDATVAAVNQAFPAVRTLRKQRNVGFAGAVNAGLRALPDCDVICVLNPDTLVPDAGLMAAARYLEAHPAAGVAGARIENPDGTLQASCRAFPGHRTALFNRHSLTTKFLPANRWSSSYLMSAWPHDEVRSVDWLSGACMFIHRRAIDAVGLFDSTYFFSIEDVDYCRRVHDAGLDVVYVPQARVQHLIGGSSRKAVYTAMAAHHRGMWHYYRTHLRKNVAVDALTAAGIVGRFAIHAASYATRSALGRNRNAPAPAVSAETRSPGAPR
jgi:GT2 family glycosyltransferase